MRFYDWYMLDGEGYSPPTVSVPANYNIPFVSVIVTSSTEATIVAGSPTTTPLSYSGTASTEPNFSGFSAIDHRPFTNADGIVFLTGLLPGIKYYLRIRAHSGANATGTYGEYSYEQFTMPKAANVGGVATTTNTAATPPNSPYKDEDSGSQNQTNETADGDASVAVPIGSSYANSGNRTVTRSLFKITNNVKDKKDYSIAIKNLNISTSSKHYAFGTGLFFQSNATKTQAEGGIGFFTDSLGMSGYYVILKTTSSLQALSEKEVKIFKIVNGKKILLSDSQESGSGQVNGIVGAKNYKIDIKVKVESNLRVIDIYINNFKISAVDITAPNTTNPTNIVLPVTPNFAMVSSFGSTMYDYIYATPINETQYSSGIMQNVYNGQFASTTLNFLYGEKVLSNFDKVSLPGGVLEEFGTVARELRKVSLKYPERPGYPLYSSLGINKYVQVLGSRLSSFGAEIYIINNAGAYTPLDDGQFNSFSVIGNYVVNTGQHEYVDVKLNEFTIAEPAVFESLWIQNESDAKKLSEWIKLQWSKQQVIVSLSVASNPLINVGDVITVSYPENNLSASNKFIVTNVDMSYEEGINTSITARSIYS